MRVLQEMPHLLNQNCNTHLKPFAEWPRSTGDAVAFGEDAAAFGGVFGAIDPGPFGGVIGRRDGIQDGCGTQCPHRSSSSELLRTCGELLRTCGTTGPEGLAPSSAAVLLLATPIVSGHGRCLKRFVGLSLGPADAAPPKPPTIPNRKLLNPVGIRIQGRV